MKYVIQDSILGTETEKVITRKEYRQFKDVRKILVKGLAIEEKWKDGSQDCRWLLKGDMGDGYRLRRRLCFEKVHEQTASPVTDRSIPVCLWHCRVCQFKALHVVPEQRSQPAGNRVHDNPAWQPDSFRDNVAGHKRNGQVHSGRENHPPSIVLPVSREWAMGQLQQAGDFSRRFRRGSKEKPVSDQSYWFIKGKNRLSSLPLTLAKSVGLALLHFHHPCLLMWHYKTPPSSLADSTEFLASRPDPQFSPNQRTRGWRATFGFTRIDFKSIPCYTIP